MKRLIVAVALVCLIFVTGACMSTKLETIAGRLPAQARIILHENPRAGDYAVQVSEVKSFIKGKETTLKMKTHQEITSVLPGRITISIKTDTDASPDQSIWYEYITDEEGNTLEAYLINKQTGNRTGLEIMKDQTMEFALQKWEKQVAIDGKDYTVYLYKADNKLKMGKGTDSKVDSALIIFSLPDIPFLISEAFNVNLINTEITYQTFSGNWIETWRRMETSAVTTHIKVNEYGRGN